LITENQKSDFKLAPMNNPALPLDRT
jgi:hypothetical protein